MHGPGRYRRRVPPELAALAAGGAALALVMWWGWHALGPAALIGAPPFFGYWRWSVRPTVLLPIGVAVVVIASRAVATRLPWRSFVAVAALAAVAWSASLAMAGGGTRQFTTELHSSVDYVAGVPTVGSHPGAYLSTYASRIRADSGGAASRRGYPIHVQGHPPGPVLTVWVLTQLGLSAIAASLVLIVAGQAMSVVGVLIVARRLSSERRARWLAPFVVLLPAALWSHALDSWFAGVAALSVGAVVVAIDRAALGEQRWRWLAVAGGIGFGCMILSSYGLALLLLVPALLAAQRRQVRVLVPACLAACVVALLPLVCGFWILDGLAATRHQYAVTVARHRPYLYFLLADLVVVLVALGPVAVAALGALGRRRGAARTAAGPGVVAVVVGAALAVLLADVSGMAKSEVERIWQPFLPWLALAALGLPAGDERADVRPLVVQSATAVTVSVALWTLW
jgi:hypothetical protein